MLRLSVVAYNDRPPGRTIAADFDELGGKIGRADDNTLVLPDRQRFISRTHALVQFRSGAFVLCDVGSASPVVVNGRQLGNGQETIIRPGDEVRIAGYTLRVEATAGEPASQDAGHAAPSSTGLPTDDPLAAFGASAAALDPFADLGAATPARAPTGSTPAGPTDAPRARAPAAETRGGAGAVIPDDFDPFAEPLPTPRSGAPAPTPTDVLGVGLAASGVGESEKIDELFGLGAAPTSDPLAAGSPLATPPELRPGDASVDPLVAIGAVPPPRSSPYPSQRDDVPEIHGSFRVPEVRPSVEPRGRGAEAAVESRAAPVAQPVPPMGSGAREAVPPEPLRSEAVPPRRPPRPAAASEAHGSTPFVPAAGRSADHEALLKAFLVGAGVPDADIPGGLTPQLMKLLGQLLRESTQGTLDLLVARATTKRQLRAETTILVARENNPLKFSPTVEDALTHLLAPKGSGFMTPIRAMRDAYNDLRSHEVGFLAGVRAALTGILARFSPGELEQRLKGKTVLDSVLPMNRQAKLWESFEQRYADISREAEDNFHVLFGKEFMRAYEEQIARLEEQERKDKGG